VAGVLAEAVAADGVGTTWAGLLDGLGAGRAVSVGDAGEAAGSTCWLAAPPLLHPVTARAMSSAAHLWLPDDLSSSNILSCPAVERRIGVGDDADLT